MPKAILFDAYGTIFDVHSVIRNAGADIAGDLDALSQLWRRKQLEYTWLHALMERYEDFWQLTWAALRSSVQQLSIPATDAQLEQLMQSYLTPDVFADASAALAQFHALPLGILSNGSPSMLDSAVRHGNLESHFAHVISVDSMGTYKPSPRVYALGTSRFKLPADEILFVSSNLWDAEGAKSFGYRVCWCNRSGAEFVSRNLDPDFIVAGLHQLPNQLP
jgi:2-haloacid dehalogenase